MPPFIRSLIAATAAVAALAGVVLLANHGVEADAATTTVPAPTYPATPDVTTPAPAPTYPVVDQLDGDGQDRFHGRTLQDFLHMDIGSDRSMTLNLAQALNDSDLAFAEFLTTGAPEVTAEQLEFLMSFAPYGDASFTHSPRNEMIAFDSSSWNPTMRLMNRCE